MQLIILKDFLVVFTLGGIIVYLFQLLRLPSVVGLLVAGVVVGPHGLSLVSGIERVELLADIGIVLLLFTVGLEFSLGQMLKSWRILLGAGAVQMVLCTLITMAGALWFFDRWTSALFWGFMAAMSSTAIVLKLLSERAEIAAPLGRITVSVLLFQDLCVVPIIFFAPALAGQMQSGMAILWIALKVIGILVGVFAASRWVVPFLLFRVLKTRNHELFLTTLLVLCLGMAWITSQAGLSLALGAFLAGLAISESEYGQQALAEAVPFTDLFGSLFFISMGMLLDISFFGQHFFLVLMVVLAVVAIKFVSGAAPVYLLGYPLSLAVLSGLALAQIGEFSFILSKVGLSLKLLTTWEYQLFLGAAVTTMLLTPVLLPGGRRWLTRWERLGNIRRHSAKLGLPEEPGTTEALKDHVIIAGYGLNGRNVARVLRRTGIPYAILELNPETVRKMHEQGEPIHFGDCSHPQVLHPVKVKQARVLVVAISDSTWTRQAVRAARRENPDLWIIVRTRFYAEAEELRALGANTVIPEEFETSIEICARVLQKYETPHFAILNLAEDLRRDAYQIFRLPSWGAGGISAELSQSLGTEELTILSDSPAAGRTLGDLALRSRVGATVLAIKREGVIHGNPGPNFCLLAEDLVFLIGNKEELTKARQFLTGSRK